MSPQNSHHTFSTYGGVQSSVRHHQAHDIRQCCQSWTDLVIDIRYYGVGGAAGRCLFADNPYPLPRQKCLPTSRYLSTTARSHHGQMQYRSQNLRQDPTVAGPDRYHDSGAGTPIPRQTGRESSYAVHEHVISSLHTNSRPRPSCTVSS